MHEKRLPQSVIRWFGYLHDLKKDGNQPTPQQLSYLILSRTTRDERLIALYSGIGPSYNELINRTDQQVQELNAVEQREYESRRANPNAPIVLAESRLAVLPTREKHALNERFGLTGEFHDQRTVAKSMGITRDTLRVIQSNALFRLQIKDWAEDI